MKIIRRIIEDLLIAIGLIFVFGVGAWFDTTIEREMHTTANTTEIHYGE